VASPSLDAVHEFLGDLGRHLRPRPAPGETFGECVHQLGPMVLGVCRRILGNHAEAEDAFQATFLTVFRKWNSVRDRRAIAGWVHRIAVRVAGRLARRRTPTPTGTVPDVACRVVDDLSWKEVRAILDEELDRLPDDLRSPLVLCYLDGISRERAADLLGWSVRTLHRRLEDGRERLHAAVTRRGLMGLALGCAVLTTEGLRATVPARLLQATCELGDRLRCGDVSPAVIAAVAPSRVLSGLAVGLVVIAVGLGGWWMQAAGPKPAPAKTDDAVRAATTFEKRPFWWGSEAFRHDGWILDSDLSADGKLLVTASWDSFIVWEAATGKKLLHIQESESVSAVGRDRISVVRLSPDGKQLATANKTHGTVRVWDVASGKLLKTIAWDEDAESAALGKLGIKGYERRKHSPDYYLALEYLGDTRLCVQSLYFTTVWDTAEFKKISTESHESSWHCGTTRDRKRILWSQSPAKPAGGPQTKLVLWDAEAGKPVRELPVEGQVIDYTAAVSEDSRLLAFVRFRDTEIIVRDWKEDKDLGALKFVPEGEHDRVQTMEFSPDGRTLYAGSTNGTLVAYDLTTKAKVRSWKAAANFLMRIHFAPDGNTIYTFGGDGLVRRWRPDGTEIPLPDGYIGQPVFAWSRARNAMAVGDGQGRVDLWNATGTKITRTLQTKGEAIVQLAFSRSGRLLAASDGKGWTRLWNLESGDQIAKFGGTEESSGWLYNVLQISDDETKLLVRTGYSVKMYRIPEGKELWLAPPKQMALFAMSPDGRTVCASSFDNPVIALYDANTFQRPVNLELPENLAVGDHDLRFTFSPDSRVLVLAASKGKVFLFDRDTGKCLGTRATEDDPIVHLGFTDDGGFVIALSYTKAFLFDAHRFEKLGEAPFDGRTFWLHGAATPGGMEKMLALFRPANPVKGGLETLWKNLDSAKPREVFEAMWQLSQAADVGPFMRKKISAVPDPDAGEIRKQIRDLDARVFAVREAASRKLSEIGPAADPFLRQALKAGLSAEAAERAERLLADLQRPLTADEVRQRRVIFALETNGGPDARRTLEAWAAGAAGVHLTEQAKQALGRLAK
jgi:RNA polymerase sigma factor (sigma-70 family)